MSIAADFEGLASLLLKEKPEFSLPSGASDDQIAKIERVTQSTLPEDFKQLYRLHDGEFSWGSKKYVGLLCNYEFLSLRHIEEVYAEQLEIRAYDQSGRLAGYEYLSCPFGYVRQVVFDPGWIPFAGYFGGFHLGIDLNPGPNGIVGQIINFGPDDSTHFQVATDLASFIKQVASQYSGRRWHEVFAGPDWSLYDEFKSRAR